MSAHELFNAIFNASPAVMILTLVAGLGLSLTLNRAAPKVGKEQTAETAPAAPVGALLGAAG